MITIKEIAKRAKVSRTTVSRVLNNSGYVSEESRARVMKVIEETGYVPSQHAQSLRTKKTKVIGVILPKVSTSTSGEIVMGIDEVFRERGYQILLTNTNLEPEKEIEYLKLLVSRRVDGIILVATNLNQKLIKEIDELTIPFVTVGQDFPNTSCVVYDDYNASKTLMNLFIEKGRNEIAYIGVQESDRAVGVERKRGYLDALKENGILIDETLIGMGHFNTESGYHAMKQIIEKRPSLPNGVFAATDRMAIGAMTYLKELKIRIPEDISVAGIGASEMAKYVSPPLTTIQYEHKHTGREVASLLLTQIEEEQIPMHKKIILSHRLVERGSM